MAVDTSGAKLLGALGLCRRAGKLTVGFDAVCEAAAKGQARLVMLTKDTSAGTQKRVRSACEAHCEVRQIPATQKDIASIIQKPAGVLAVADKELATLCQNALGGMGAGDEEEPDW